MFTRPGKSLSFPHDLLDLRMFFTEVAGSAPPEPEKKAEANESPAKVCPLCGGKSTIFNIAIENGHL